MKPPKPKRTIDWEALWANTLRLSLRLTYITFALMLIVVGYMWYYALTHIGSPMHPKLFVSWGIVLATVIGLVVQWISWWYYDGKFKYHRSKNSPIFRNTYK